MSQFNLPQGVCFVLERLNGCGYEAFVVGGCVRDHLMGRVPSDYDVTTNARPHEMMEVFADCRVIETGLKHGTLTVLSHGMSIEATTYRVDGAYDDGRHPNEVTFTASLEEDLCRRDFTVNAIAYSPRDGFVDPFGGREDIERKRIICVGEAEKRFSEDALRILRAVRFASALGFLIEKGTADAVMEMYPTLAKISRERIYQELTKLLLGPSAAEVLWNFAPVIAFALDGTGTLITAEDIRLAAGRVSAASRHSEMRYAALFYENGRGLDVVDTARKLYSSLKPSRKSLLEVLAFLENRFADTGDRHTVKKLMGRYGADFPRELMGFRGAMGLLDAAEREAQLGLYEALAAENPCVTVGQLAVDGKDAAAAGLKGADIGKALSRLLDAVMREELPNERSVLMEHLPLKNEFSTGNCGKLSE